MKNPYVRPVDYDADANECHEPLAELLLTLKDGEWKLTWVEGQPEYPLEHGLDRDDNYGEAEFTVLERERLVELLMCLINKPTVWDDLTRKAQRAS